MAFLEGKTRSDKNKTIAAIVLGVIAVVVLVWAFGGMLWPTGAPVTPPLGDSSPSPSSPASNPDGAAQTAPAEMAQVNNDYLVTKVRFDPARYDARLSGRNIFAFYEPPAFTPTPTPDTGPTFVPPTPRPPAPMDLNFVSPTSTYAGSKEFRLEAVGDKFTDDTRIIFNGNPLPTTFISPQKLSASVPASLITRSGTGSVFVNTPDGSLYSYPLNFTIVEPPKPDFDYIGLIARQHYNNDTAYFQDRGRRDAEPFTARLNDVVKGRFKVVSISSEEVEFEDVRLGFRHKLELLRPKDDGPSTSQPTTRGNTPIRGIPTNIRRAPNAPNRPTREDLNRAIEELQKRRRERQNSGDQGVDTDKVEIPVPRPVKTKEPPR